MDSHKNINKIKGMLYSVCLGDALGLPFEFRFSSHSNYTGNLSDNRLNRKNRYGNNTIFDYGQLSDDSEMTIILLRHIYKYNNIVTEELVKDYIDWANIPTTCSMGKNTKLLFKNIKTYKGYLNRYKKIDNTNQSNGHLMRSTPLSLFDNCEFWDKECRITNPHPTCIYVNRIYINMLRKALNNIDKQIIICDAIYECSNSNIKELEEVIYQIKSNINRDTSQCKGWVIHSIYCVLYCFIHFNTIAEVMEWIINQKGDTDTNGAIVCGLFGAYIGYDELFKQQKDNINILYNCDTSGGNKIRPDIYHTSSINKILNI